MSGFTNEVVNAKNVDFSGSSTISGRLTTNGQMLIGSTALNAGGTNINVGTMASPSSSLTIGYSSPNITMEVTGAAAGKVLQGAGAGIPPTYSTAAYPVEAGTSGNVLTSNGVNWESAAAPLPSQLMVATLTLTSQQVKALHATPIQFIAAPGAGKVICFASPIWASLNHGGSNNFASSGVATVTLYYGVTTAVSTTLFQANTGLVSSSSILITVPTLTSSVGGTAITLYQNQAVNAYNISTTEVSGNAANNNTITFTALYYIATL